MASTDVRDVLVKLLLEKLSGNESLLTLAESLKQIGPQKTEKPSISTANFTEINSSSGSDDSFDNSNKSSIVDSSILNLPTGQTDSNLPQHKHFTCDVCQTTFPTDTLLRNHLFEHVVLPDVEPSSSGLSTAALPKPFECNEPNCSKKFKSSGELTRHVRYRHTKEKKFKCSICSYTSCESSKVRRHFKGKHRVSEPQKCDICGTFTPDKLALIEHRKFHMRKDGEIDFCIQLGDGVPSEICEHCNLRIEVDDVSTHLRLQHRNLGVTINRSYFKQPEDI
jgi:hypothetical protein